MLTALYIASAVATLAMAGIAALRWWKRRRKGEPDHVVPTPPRSPFSVLVVDDKKFEHVERLKRDGFTVTFRNDLEQFRDVDDFQFDLILMDLHGVGLKLSDDGGRGVIRHIRKIAPTQLVLAYTAHQGGPSNFEGVFQDADQVLDKGASYLSFKTSIEDNLARLRTPEHYIERSLPTISTSGANRLRPVIEAALGGEPVDERTSEAVKALKAEQRDPAERALRHAGIVGRRLRALS